MPSASIRNLVRVVPFLDIAPVFTVGCGRFSRELRFRFTA